MANGKQPTCQGTQPSDTQVGKTVAVLLAAFGIPGIAASLIELYEGSLLSLLGVLVSPAVAASAAAGGLGVLLIALVGARRSILATRPGTLECYAGVVTRIEEAFSDAWQTFFPFTAQHDRIDVVVKPTYWEVVERSPQQFIWCNTDSKSSPLLRTYFRTPETVSAATGAMVGAGVSAPIGIWLGILAGAAIGCLTFFGCLLAILVALTIAVAITLVGSAVGGGIGRLTGGTGGHEQTNATIRVGNYVTVEANLVVHSDNQNAWVAWWAHGVTLHGSSTRGEGAGGTAPFNFADPHDNLEFDACHRSTEPRR